ncbi:ADP-ribosylation factor-like protein 6-interacting protein 1 isoform X1 [Chironomus tepperi]|uniref:ADP-ribosylation factor-like protein 6-interacting protein 1 isoform X1 n=1 Tax=Chironomus tepperi TaxID=113505 RepID=UPI00391EFDCE
MENDKKKIFNKVKHDLEQWREVLCIMNGVLKWEQSFFPGIIFGVLTFLFIILWWLDLSSLTLIAFITMLITILDYGYPLVSKFIFKPENWSGTQEKLYENIIQEIVDVKLCIEGSISSFFNSRAERSTFYLITVTAGSIFLAYIGSTFNNLFLLYLVVLVFAMYPGLKEKGIVKLVLDQIKAVVGPYLKKIRPDKAASEKTD